MKAQNAPWTNFFLIELYFINMQKYDIEWIIQYNRYSISYFALLMDKTTIHHSMHGLYNGQVIYLTSYPLIRRIDNVKKDGMEQSKSALGMQ